MTAWSTNGVRTTTLVAGQPYDMILLGPAFFLGSNPIQVAQFAQGGSSDSRYNSGDHGDPCEILLPPIGHYSTSYTVLSPVGDFGTNFLNLIVPQSALATTFVDGLVVASNSFVAITNSGYWAAQVPVAGGTNHTVISSQPVQVEAYGFGDADAYSFLGGLVTFP